MVASQVPIYLGCAGLIVGGLGLGAHQMLGGGSGSSKDAATEQPLFARSVEQAAPPATKWPSKTTPSVDVAYYGPMVELLTQPTSSTPAPLANPSRAAARQEASQEQQPPDDSGDVDVRSRSDRRGREFEDRRQSDGERRVVIREETREPEQRVVRRSERPDFGFCPFRVFGIFDQR